MQLAGQRFFRDERQEVAGWRAFSISESCQEVVHPQVLPTIQTEEALRQAELVRGGPIDRETARAAGRWAEQGAGVWRAYLQMEMVNVSVEVRRILVGTAWGVRTLLCKTPNKANSLQPPSKRGAALDVPWL